MQIAMNPLPTRPAAACGLGDADRRQLLHLCSAVSAACEPGVGRGGHAGGRDVAGGGDDRGGVSQCSARPLPSTKSGEVCLCVQSSYGARIWRLGHNLLH